MAARTSLSIAQPLPAERFFRVSLFLLLLTAILTLVGTGKIDLFTSIVATFALLYRVRRWWYGHEPELTSRTATFMVLCYLIFFPMDMFFLSRSLAANSPNPPLYAALISSVHFLIFVLLVRLYSARTDRDAHFLVMLAFAAVLASAVLTVDTTFLFLFFLFLLFAVATYSGLELRRGASGALLPPTASMPTSEKKLARALGLAALTVSIGAILCGIVLFFLLPRVSAGYLGKTSFNPTLLSGFTDQVELGTPWQTSTEGDGRRQSAARRRFRPTVTAGSHYATNRNLAKCAEKFCNSPCCRSRWHPMRSSSPGTLWRFAGISQEKLAVSATGAPICTGIPQVR